MWNNHGKTLEILGQCDLNIKWVVKLHIFLRLFKGNHILNQPTYA
jgi:hypothetical protein